MVEKCGEYRPCLTIRPAMRVTSRMLSYFMAQSRGRCLTSRSEPEQKPFLTAFVDSLAGWPIDPGEDFIVRGRSFSYSKIAHESVTSNQENRLCVNTYIRH